MIRQAFADHAAVLEAAGALVPVLEQAAGVLATALGAGHRVLLCGNGGSAADAQHFAGEMVGRFTRERRALPAIALGAEVAALTAIANDYGFEKGFERQVEAIGRPGDVLVAISTSGGSRNVIAAAARARALGCQVIALTGEGGGALAAEADVVVAVPSRVVARIQEIHGLALHALADAIESHLAGGHAPGS